jgi:3-carboxy-cis,cis-muconate cycloisomerase
VRIQHRRIWVDLRLTFEFSFDRLSKETENVGYPVLPLVTQLTEMVEEKHARYIHWGATTQDIMDTATILQMRNGLALIRKLLLKLNDSLRNLAMKYRDT